MPEPDPELSSAMSYGQILAVFQDHADYDLFDPNPARARLFIRAGRMLMSPAIRRSSQGNRGEEVELEPEIIERNVNKALGWLASYQAAIALPRQTVPAPYWRDE